MSERRTIRPGRRGLAMCVAIAIVGVSACGDDDDSADVAGGGASSAAGTGPETSNVGEAPATSGDTGPATTGQTSCPEVSDGGSITMGVFSETRGLDPVVSSGNGVSGGTEMAAIYDTLMRWNPDTGDYDPRVAESLEPNDDFSEWTLTLRSGIRFGNGDPLTTEAVQYSIDRHLSPDHQSVSRAQAANVAEMEIVDDLTMVFHLTEPWASFPYLLSDESGMIVNPAVVEAMAPEEFSEHPQGAGVGPFEPVRFVPNEEIVLEAKDDYWNGPVCVDELRFVNIPGGSSTYGAFRSGDVDVAFLREPSAVARAEDDGVAGRFHNLQNGGDLLILNNGRPGTSSPTADERVRLAIGHALDPEVIDERVNDGAGMPTSMLIHSTSRLTNDAAGPEYDPERAAALVEEVKAEGEWDGTLRLTCDSSPANAATALAVEGQLEGVGFDVEIDSVATTQDVIQKVIIEGDYDAACWGTAISEANPWIALDHYRSDNPASSIAYGDPAMDAALADLKVAATLEEQQRALAEIQGIWNETMPSVVLGAIDETIIWDDDVSGLTFNQETVVFFDQAVVNP